MRKDCPKPYPCSGALTCPSPPCSCIRLSVASSCRLHHREDHADRAGRGREGREDPAPRSRQSRRRGRVGPDGFQPARLVALSASALLTIVLLFVSMVSVTFPPSSPNSSRDHGAAPLPDGRCRRTRKPFRRLRQNGSARSATTRFRLPRGASMSRRSGLCARSPEGVMFRMPTRSRRG